jgi:hypothetical protein
MFSYAIYSNGKLQKYKNSIIEKIDSFLLTLMKRKLNIKTETNQ